MQQPPPGNANLFQDALICGAIGGGLAWLFGKHLFLWMLLCAMVGPIVVLWAARAIHALPVDLPGKTSGAYEFALFSLLAAILIALGPIQI
jgi:hypothetical protein